MTNPNPYDPPLYASQATIDDLKTQATELAASYPAYTGVTADVIERTMQAWANVSDLDAGRIRIEHYGGIPPMNPDERSRYWTWLLDPDHPNRMESR